MSFNTLTSSNLHNTMQALQYADGPVSRLSIDMLQYIFEVCRTWRVLAHRTPTLWTIITMSDKKLHEPQFLFDRVYFLRSQQCSLTVYLDLRSITSVPYIEELYQRLLPQLWRIRSFTVRAKDDHPILAALYALLTQPMPRLERFEIERPRNSAWGHPGHTPLSEPLWPALPTPIVPISVTLKSLTVCGVHLDWTRWSFAGLQELVISDLPNPIRPSIEALSTLLQTCADTLQHLELQAAAPVEEVPNGEGDVVVVPIRRQAQARVVLPHLRTLVLGYVEPSDATTFVVNFECPAVRALTLCDIARDLIPVAQRDAFWTDAYALLSVLLPSACPMPSVEELTLKGVFTSSSPMVPIQLLTSFPRLTSLTLDDSSESFIEALACDPRVAFPECDPQTLPAFPAAHLQHFTAAYAPFNLIGQVFEHRTMQADGPYPVLNSLAIFDPALSAAVPPQALAGQLAMFANRVVLHAAWVPKTRPHWTAGWDRTSGPMSTGYNQFASAPFVMDVVDEEAAYFDTPTSPVFVQA
ncbi:hypothetical protein BV25DRAFT_1178625 [Artomyces pyxidatus]|uniref:Uncharacterized protein n=1 Tax=Artomyces pyxidatus TaxID=48021 RepID=A0ACB8SSP5_9AGAM|nr:hypothetical protein BV25DRAFT_1178625 [Artomyces pyxidatus]